MLFAYSIIYTKYFVMVRYIFTFTKDEFKQTLWFPSLAQNLGVLFVGFVVSM